MKTIPTVLLSSLLVLAGCSDTQPTSAPAAPVSRHAVADESALLDMTLSEAAIARLGIALSAAVAGQPTPHLLTSGEMIVPAIRTGGLPITSTTDLNQRAAAQAAADGEVARARAALKLAKQAYERADALIQARAGSVRARDEAANTRAAARAALAVAQSQRQLLGPAVKTINTLDTLWVRVPVYSADLAQLDHQHPAQVNPLGGTGQPVTITPVAAPPTSDFLAGTTDFFYAVDNADQRWRVGQRVAVTLDMTCCANDLIELPQSAVVRDMNGGTWVYERIEARTFRRRRIEIAASNATTVWITNGVVLDASVVSTGAAELFGAEFGVGH